MPRHQRSRKRGGIEAERSGMWKEMARIIGEVRPQYAFVENSPMLTSRGLGTVLADLASLGFDAEWGVLSAADVGANHLRERIWIVAKNTKQSRFFSYSQHNRNGWRKQQSKSIEKKNGNVANTRCELWSEGNSDELDTHKKIRSSSSIFNKSSSQGQNVSNSSSIGQQGQRKYEQSINPAKNCQRKTDYVESIGSSDFWKAEPNVGRVANGVAASMDRLKAIGNGQVPLCAATAWKLLKKRIDE